MVSLHVLDMTEKEQYELLKMRKLSQDYYRQKGEGRPTKKDRRDMDDFMETENHEADDDTDWEDCFREETEI